MTAIVEVEGITKKFGDTTALGGVDLHVDEGSVLALLGPNGAGKTTLVRILSTLLEPDGGTARVAGFDVVKEDVAVRRCIGTAGQFAAVDETLTGRENLEMVGRLSRLSKRDAGDAGTGSARAGVARRRGRSSAQDVLRRHATSHRPRRGAGGATACAAPRRTDHRSRSRQPARPVGLPARPRQRRRHGVAHHAVPRGSRPAGARRGGDRSRVGDRRGHPHRAQAALRGRRARRHRRVAGRSRPRGRRARRRGVGGAAHRTRRRQGVGPGGERRRRARRRGAPSRRDPGDGGRPRVAPSVARRRVPRAHRSHHGRRRRTETESESGSHHEEEAGR